MPTLERRKAKAEAIAVSLSFKGNLPASGLAFTTAAATRPPSETCANEESKCGSAVRAVARGVVRGSHSTLAPGESAAVGSSVISAPTSLATAAIHSAIGTCGRQGHVQETRTCERADTTLLGS
eukprot:scaffold261729_cov29-Tisochrysis_lutea.AAC.4